MRLVSLALPGLCVALAACGGGSSTSPGSTLSITLPANPIASGTSVQAVATFSNGTPASSVTWSSTNTGIASISSTGLITGHTTGTSMISAVSGGASAQVQIAVVPGAPAKVIVYTGDGQSGPKGSQLRDPLCTNVLDAAGNKIIGVVVNYTVATGGGQIAAPTAPSTDAAGIATSGLWTLGAVAGTQTVTASSAGATSVTFMATAQ